MEKISRKQALAGNLPKYFTGERCVNGHIAERYTQSGACASCVRGIVDKSPANLARQTAAKLLTTAKNDAAAVDTAADTVIKELKKTTAYTIAFIKESCAADIAKIQRETLAKRAAIIENAEAAAHALLAESVSLDAAYMAESRIKAKALEDFVAVCPTARPDNLEEVKAKLLALVKARCSLLTIDDVWEPNQKPTWGGIRYAALCHKSDYAQYIAETNRMFGAT